MTKDRTLMFKWVMVLLSIIALILSGFLCFHTMTGRGLIGCAAGTNCDQVLGSRWSVLFGIIPTSGLAFCLYIVLTLCLIFSDKMKDDPAFGSFLWKLTMVSSGAIVGSAIWFIWLQRAYIHALCPYCMATHGIGIVLSALIVFFIVKERRIAGPWWQAGCFFTGLLLAAALAGVQLVSTPRTAYERGFVTEELPTFDASEMPAIGNPTAAQAVTLLYDYRCSHCRELHTLLPEIITRFDGQLAFILCPVPLSQQCNPYIPAGRDLFKGSCELTRAALAVWLSDRDAFYIFDSWLFEAQAAGKWQPRNPDEAMAKAASLIGQEALDKALNDNRINQYLDKAFELFGRTSTDGKASVPRLILGRRWLTPDADDAEGMTNIIKMLCAE